MWAPLLDIYDFLGHVPYAAALWLMAFVPPALLLVTTPKDSILRLLWVPCLLALSHALCVELFSATLFAGFRVPCAALTGNALAVALMYLTIERRGPEDLAQAGVYERGDGIPAKVVRTVGMFHNFRAVGTAWQVKRVGPHPQFLSKRRGTDGGIPLKVYLARQTAIIIWQYLFLDLTFDMGLRQPAGDTHAMVGDASEFSYRNLTPEEWQGRITIGLLTWLTSSRIIIDMYNRVASVLVMSLGLSSPDAWPPVFGSVADMYTIRGFWSTFWHQYLRWPLTSFSSFITRRVLGLPTPSVVERYLNVFFAFLGSGLVHVLIDYYDPQVPPGTFLPIMAFFTSFSLAVMIEDGVQAIWRWATKAGPRSDSAPVPLWHKFIGYAWVSTWLVMTTPWFLYPKVRMPPDTAAFVPVLVTPHIGATVVGGLLAAGAPVLLFGFGAEI